LVRVWAWGSSMAIPIPKRLAQALGVEKGTYIRWRIRQHGVLTATIERPPWEHR